MIIFGLINLLLVSIPVQSATKSVTDSKKLNFIFYKDFKTFGISWLTYYIETFQLKSALRL